MKKKIIVKDGQFVYYDKVGNELHDGDYVLYDDGRIKQLCSTESGQLGVDATNPAWIRTGRAVAFEHGAYPLEQQEMELITKVQGVNKAIEVIKQMCEPTQDMDGVIFSAQVCFINDNEQEDETSFDIKCVNNDWRTELLELWICFAEENNFDVSGIYDCWACPLDDKEIALLGIDIEK